MPDSAPKPNAREVNGRVNALVSGPFFQRIFQRSTQATGSDETRSSIVRRFVRSYGNFCKTPAIYQLVGNSRRPSLAFDRRISGKLRRAAAHARATYITGMIIRESSGSNAAQAETGAGNSTDGITNLSILRFGWPSDTYGYICERV